MVTTHPYKRLIIKSILLKKILKRVSREIMGSVLTQYFKILITTVPEYNFADKKILRTNLFDDRGLCFV